MLKQERFISSRRVSELYSISERKLAQLVANGDIPSSKVGRCRRFSIEELDAWFSQQRAQPAVDISKLVQDAIDAGLSLSTVDGELVIEHDADSPLHQHWFALLEAAEPRVLAYLSSNGGTS